MNSQIQMVSQPLVDNFKTLFNTMNASNVHNGLIELVYSDNVEFKDCFHHIKGRDNFIQYCDSIYENVQYSRFEFHQEMVDDNMAMLTWTMHYAHPRLNGGNDIEVHGASHILFEDKIYFHQDYVDGGELLYEHIPGLRWVLKKLKNRMM